MYTYTVEMTFAAAFLCLSLFTHCEQIKIMFTTEKHEKFGGRKLPNNSGRYYFFFEKDKNKLIVKRNKICLKTRKICFSLAVI